MQDSIPNYRKWAHPPRKGFALVVTTLMLSLLLLLGLAMTTLSSVEMRRSSRERELQQAKANARLALQLALGELQFLAGPDQRVTASSALVGDAARPHLTGVWEGWKWDGRGNVPDWDAEKSRRFKGWLISAAKPGAEKQLEFASTPSQAQTVKLMAPIDHQMDGVDAEIVKVRGKSPADRGGLAWAVFDQSQKIDISLPDYTDEDSESANRFDLLSAAPEPGFDAVSKLDWKVLAVRAKERTRLTSLEQSRLLGLQKIDASFHDAAAGTFSLLTDASCGGLATDLSTLFKDGSLPREYANRFIYSGLEDPLVAPPNRFPGANPLPSADPSWAILHSYYRSYQDLSGGSVPERLVNVASLAPRPEPSARLTGPQLLREPAFNQLQIAPAIAKAQFVFSLTFGVNQNTLNTMWANGGARSSPASLRDNYITWLVIDPVITLWNPYNVSLRFTGASMELHRIPLAFRLYKNGARLADSYTRLTDAHTQADFGGRKNRFYLLKLLPELGEDSIVMQPGEHIVFSGQEWTLHGSHSYHQQGITMRPGFYPPAGENSSPYIGGITTQNLFVGTNGTSTGRDYGKTIRTVAVKGGDRIEIEVKPERAGVDNAAETGGHEVTGYLKYYIGSNPREERRLIGGIELDYGEKESEYLPQYSRSELPAIIVNPAIPRTAPGSSTGVSEEDRGADAALRWKEPFLIATFQQKTERDSKFPSRSWINNGPGNLYASAGIDQNESFEHHQYEFKWEPMNDWPPDSPTIEISNERNRGYGGAGVYAQTGTELATFSTLPTGPAVSLGQFSHAPFNTGGSLPLITHPFGNSFAPALISPDQVIQAAGKQSYLDHSYFANNALLDSTFLSTAADQSQFYGQNGSSRKTLLEEFFRGRSRLPNRRFIPHLGRDTAENLLERLDSDENSYHELAANLLIQGGFNVNSTRIAAWQALLASNFGAAVQLANGELSTGEGVPVLRNLPSVDRGTTDQPTDREKWNGYRRLSADQIETLAEAIVDQVKARGPFQSLAEFANRRPGSNQDLAYSGAIQAAIDQSRINQSYLNPEFDLTRPIDSNSRASYGNTADGAPAVITQADLLTPLLPQLIVRGDTFIIRAYGESTSYDGHRSQAWCEATVQRYPEFVDTLDRPTTTDLNPVNQRFGRRFEILSFRWLRPSEI